jgi:CRP-like cAMP-binding protein
MLETSHIRLSRELFLATLGPELGKIEPWVTDRLTILLEETDVAAGRCLFSAGDLAESFYFLRDGRVRLARKGRAPFTVHGPGVVGMFDAILDRPRVDTAVAEQDTQLMRVPTEPWVELLEDSFELTRATVLGAAREVTVLEGKLRSRGLAPAGAASSPPALASARLGPIDRLAVLMDAPPLRAAGLQTLSDLAASSEEVAFSPGVALFQRAVPRERVFLVIEGEVQATREPSQGVWRFGPGEIVCGAAAIGEPALSWRAVAQGPVRTLAYRIEDWFDLMELHFDLVRSAVTWLALERERLHDLLAAPAHGVRIGAMPASG